MKFIFCLAWLWYAFAVDKSGVIITTLAGSGSAGSVNGIGRIASFHCPTQVVSNAGGSLLYVIDRYNHAIRSLVTSTVNVTTIAGTGSGGFVDGACSVAQVVLWIPLRESYTLQMLVTMSSEC